MGLLPISSYKFFGTSSSVKYGPNDVRLGLKSRSNFFLNATKKAGVTTTYWELLISEENCSFDLGQIPQFIFRLCPQF